MSDPFIPRWFCTLDGRSLYALEAPDQLVEHQQIGSRHAVHTLEATTYPDRLRIADLVDASVCGHEVAHGKPDPEVFLLAASRLGVDPSRCVVVEDAGAGVDAARAGGMASIGLVSPGRTHEELAHADLVVDRFDRIEVEDFLRLIDPDRSISETTDFPIPR